MSKLFDIYSEPYFESLGQRKGGFELAVSHVMESRHKHIIETGTARTEDSYEGDGLSTVIWDRLAQAVTGVTVCSIDCNQENVDLAKRLTKKVFFRVGDSVQILNGMAEHLISETSLLYLDSYDWHPSVALDSSFHHMAELASVWRLLPSGCMIMVDDRHGERLGKHLMIQFFMSKLQIEPVYKGYQIAWIKD